MDHPFDHFVKEAPVKVYEIIGKFFSLKEDQTKFWLIERTANY
jgi:hypothetical protein